MTRSFCRVALAVAALVLGCQEPTAAPSRVAPRVEPVRTEGTPEYTTLTPFASLQTCRVDQGGPFLDLGEPGSDGLRAFRLEPLPGLSRKIWQSQGHTQFERRSAHYDLWLRGPVTEGSLRVQAQATGARSLSVLVDGRSLGRHRVPKNAFETLQFSLPKAGLAAGRHQLVLRWSTRKSTSKSYGSVRWIHLVEATPEPLVLRPPQHASLRQDVLLDGTALQALLLRPTTAVACPLSAGVGSVLTTSIGYVGEGSGIARIRALRDGQPPLVLFETRITGGTAGSWRELTIPLARVGDQPFHLELSAPQSSHTGAVAFGETLVSESTPQPARIRADWVVVVVFAGLHRNLLPPFTHRGLPTFQSLARYSTRFTAYRVPTTRVGGSMATLLTGSQPYQHRLDHLHVKLSERYALLPDRLRGLGGRSALFSGVPHTRKDFGFGRGWNVFSTSSPVQDFAATHPFEQARRWVAAEAKRDELQPRFLLIHARGAHPPWDLTRAEVSELPPENYHGVIEPRRGGILLASVRNRRRRSARRLRNSDWIRLNALQQRSLAKQDEALGALIQQLKQSGVWDRTLLAVLGDVSIGEPPEAPFGDGRPLHESRLSVPLWLKLPGPPSEVRTSSVLVDTANLSRTLETALGLPPSPLSKRQGLEEALIRGATAQDQPYLATREGSYSARWGDWLLKGTSPREPRLCQITVDPRCTIDLLAEHPLLTEALWKSTYRAIHPVSPSPDHAAQRAVVSKETSAALRVWGD